MNLVELDQALRKLRLSGMADVLDTRLQQAQVEQMPPIDLVAALVSDELQRRQDRLLARRHKQARFRDPDRSLDSFDFALVDRELGAAQHPADTLRVAVYSLHFYTSPSDLGTRADRSRRRNGLVPSALSRSPSVARVVRTETHRRLPQQHGQTASRDRCVVPRLRGHRRQPVAKSSASMNSKGAQQWTPRSRQTSGILRFAR